MGFLLNFFCFIWILNYVEPESEGKNIKTKVIRENKRSKFEFEQIVTKLLKTILDFKHVK